VNRGGRRKGKGGGGEKKGPVAPPFAVFSFTYRTRGTWKGEEKKKGKGEDSREIVHVYGGFHAVGRQKTTV